MRKLPNVSVIIPTYNRAHLAGIAIRSVLEQTYQSSELIMVDDTSVLSPEEAIQSFGGDRIDAFAKTKTGAEFGPHVLAE